VLQVLERVKREVGTTTAVITHNAAIAAMGHRVIRLRDFTSAMLLSWIRLPRVWRIIWSM
jgi:ABC-type lipoprotein export system ATPase subunit